MCGICGRRVDKSIKYPDLMSPCVDHHIIPVSKGGNPSDLFNLQLTHFACNTGKNDKLYKDKPPKLISNRNLPHSRDCTKN